MHNMFYNYDHNINKKLEPKQRPCPESEGPSSASNTALLYDIKGRPLGVEVRAGMPFDLYFHLEELHGYNLQEIIYDASVELLFLSVNHKVALEKHYNAIEQYDSSTSDLVLHIDQEEANKLKQETYQLKVSLVWEDGTYILFSEQDGVVSIR